MERKNTMSLIILVPEYRKFQIFRRPPTLNFPKNVMPYHRQKTAHKFKSRAQRYNLPTTPSRGLAYGINSLLKRGARSFPDGVVLIDRYIRYMSDVRSQWYVVNNTRAQYGNACNFPSSQL